MPSCDSPWPSRRAARRRPGVAMDVGVQIRPDHSVQQVVEVVANADVRAITQTVNQLDYQALDLASRAMAAASRVDVYGIGSSASVAYELETRLFRVGRPGAGVDRGARGPDLRVPAHRGRRRDRDLPLGCHQGGRGAVAAGRGPRRRDHRPHRRPAIGRRRRLAPHADDGGAGDVVPERQPRRAALPDDDRRLSLHPRGPAQPRARRRVDGADRAHLPVARRDGRAAAAPR